MDKTPKMSTCKHCGAEIAAGAKICPKCGGKNKKPIYKRLWFIILAIFIVLGLVGGVGSSNSGNGAGDTTSGTEQKIEYKKVDISDMMRALDENPSKASDEYMDQYIEVTGRLAQIDSDNADVEIIDPSDDMAVALGDLAGGITCKTGYDEDIIKSIKELKKGDNVTVKGCVTDVGEYVKYEMKIDSIK